jgi:hypothetical protein
MSLTHKQHEGSSFVNDGDGAIRLGGFFSSAFGNFLSARNRTDIYEQVYHILNEVNML